MSSKSRRGQSRLAGRVGPCPIALIGQKFMGRAHGNAWTQAGRFFETKRKPVLHTACARDRAELEQFQANWGFEHSTTRWRDIVDNDEIEVVDVSTPNHVHREPSIAMLESGKHVACEKPLAGTLDDARAMRDAAKKSKAKSFVWFNYRRCPAIGLAKRLIDEGRLGRIYQIRCRYLQDWGGPGVPLLWRFQKKFAGSGAHGDLNAHSIDLARFLTGDEFREVSGALSATFIKQRPRLSGKGKGRSDVDDALLFLATMKSGAIASFEATRLASGYQNANQIEIHGDRGAIRWDFENMNSLDFHDVDDGPRESGWNRIMCTRAGEHPYAANWWPDAHILGYEHGFANMAADILRVLGGEEPELPLPDFQDAYETQRVLEAALLSAKNRCPIPLRELS